MAQKVQVLLIDDVHGEPADETVTFALDGVSYEIDLTSDNAAALREGLTTWISNARRVGRQSKSTTSQAPRRSSGGSNDAQAIREWAQSQGMTVSARGRISAEVRTAYEAAH
ncbi:Lsr2 family protein [uncultured Cellulomonas sp.]|uniref:histone-like nucleoid-structuring protein Lsr2 n=1 Tax=uncultured Cellulomonas sp. TaxID=189682 RepID=UPI00262A3900|nr:Lsr2 family protein [uncultured Cellulomonas sp.]